jgi:lipopolysaccharide export system permease protein
MSILNRYLLGQHLFLAGLCLGIGAGLYLLVDLMDKLHELVEAGLSVGRILTMYGLRLPLIITQILPAALLICQLVHGSMLVSSRELLALQSGGVRPWRVAGFFIVAALVWAGLHFIMSQTLVIEGREISNRIWNEEVRGRKPQTRVVSNVWFRDGNWVGHVGSAVPDNGTGQDLRLFELSPDGREVLRVAEAPVFSVQDKTLTLEQALISDFANLKSSVRETATLPVDLDLRALVVVETRSSPEYLPYWRLADQVRQLEAMGSNVERLRTALYAKISYAFTIVGMSLLAQTILAMRLGIYKSLLFGLLGTLVFYGVHLFGVSAGEQGILPPLLGAWFGNLVVSGTCLALLFWPVVRTALIGLNRGVNRQGVAH